MAQIWKKKIKIVSIGVNFFLVLLPQIFLKRNELVWD